MIGKLKGIEKRFLELEKLLSSLNPIDSLEFLLEKMNGTSDNQEFLDSMNS